MSHICHYLSIIDFYYISGNNLVNVTTIFCLPGISATVLLGQTMSHAPDAAGPTTTATGGEGLTLTPVAAVASQGVLGAK